MDEKSNKVLAEGYFLDTGDPDLERLSDDVAEAMRLAGDGVIGPSVDLEPDMDMALVRKGTDEPIDFDELMELEPDDEVEMLFTRVRIMGATLVSGPAFEHSSTDFQLYEDTDGDEKDECPEGQGRNDDGDCVDLDELALVASVIGSTSLPVGDRALAWSGSAATGRMFDAATSEGGTVNVSQVSRGFLYRDPDADAQTKAAYKLPFADIVDGTLTIVPRGVAATAGGRGVGAASIPDAEKATIRRKICTLYGKVRAKFDDWPDCPFDTSKAAALVASLGQDMPDKLPSRGFFEDQGLSEPTQLTWDADGRIFGHIALSGTCHAGFGDICHTPPMSAADYRWFHRYPIETDDGIVWAGRISAGGFHAPLTKPFDAAVDHYDDLTTVAYVVAGTDEHGIWVSGALQPDLDDRIMSILGRRKPSGDWRGTSDGLELIEVLALAPGPRELSEPGFPVEVHVSNGVPTALVACLGPVSRETSSESSESAFEIDYGRLGAAVASEIRRYERTEARRAELVAAIAETDRNERDRRRAELAGLIGV